MLLALHQLSHREGEGERKNTLTQRLLNMHIAYILKTPTVILLLSLFSNTKLCKSLGTDRYNLHPPLEIGRKPLLKHLYTCYRSITVCCTFDGGMYHDTVEMSPVPVSLLKDEIKKVLSELLIVQYFKSCPTDFASLLLCVSTTPISQHCSNLFLPYLLVLMCFQGPFHTEILIRKEMFS